MQSQELGAKLKARQGGSKRRMRYVALLVSLLIFVGVLVGLFGGSHDTALAVPNRTTDDIERTPTRWIGHEVTSTPIAGVKWDEGKGGSPTEIVNMTPIPEIRFSGWERMALRDLADVNAWPTVVTYDNSGRLKVQNNRDESGWTVRAHIRGFDYRAGASAAFNAEQEDARMSGLQIQSRNFYSFRAYAGSLRDRTGATQELRFRWLARTWIFGVDIRPDGSGQPLPDPAFLSEQLLTLAVQRGLPPPPNQVPTPNPTWSLPPNPTPTVSGCDAYFSDVPTTYWAYGLITTMACNGNVTGYSDGTFRPERSTTRAQLAKMLVLTQGWAFEVPDMQSFRDVSPSHPFYSYIETAAAHNVISGYSDRSYRPDFFVTRAQVAKMLVRARGWTPFEDTPIVLCDVPTNYWAWYYIQAALQNELFTGYANNCFLPEAQATRAQLAKVLLIASR